MNELITERSSTTDQEDSWLELVSGVDQEFKDFLHWQRTQLIRQPRAITWWQGRGATVVELGATAGATNSVFGVGQPEQLAQLLDKLKLDARFFMMPRGTWEYPSFDRSNYGDPSHWDLLLTDHIKQGVTPPHFGGDIVEFDEAEHDEVSQFQTEVYPHGRLRVDEPDTRWFGLRFEGKIDCVIGASGWTTRECVHLGSFATRPSARGRGIGTAVMAHVSEHAIKALGAVSLGVYRENRAAIALYHRLGFRTIFQADSIHYSGA